ncbi:MAG: hypothetical protein KAS90_06695, partial [Candidatus Aenigmarchaeota archaeon]|nr:hypothetical protein [Candidatus Aenigmarchaeota archaeon]
MKKVITLLILAILILSNTATAIDYSQFENIELDNETVEYIKYYVNNQQTDNKALDTLKSTFGEEILEITLTETGQTFTIVTENGTLENIKKGSDPEATMKLRVNETILENLESLESSNDPAQLILDAINSDKIEYEATENASLKTKMLMFLSKIMLKVATFVTWVL